MKLIKKFEMGQILKFADGSTETTQQRIAKVQEQMRKEGVREGSDEWKRRVKEAYGSRNISGGYGYHTSSAKGETAKGKGPRQTTAENVARLKALYDKYNQGGIDEASAKELQSLLVNAGYNVDFTDSKGRRRTGMAAVDGRIGNSTKKALRRFEADQKAYDNRTFEEAYAAANNGALPIYNTVAGRDRDAVRGWSNAIYQYYIDNPLAEFRQQDLPYLTNDMKDMILQNRLQYNKKNPNEMSTIGRDARAGYYGQAGQRWLGQQEAENVRDAIDRGAKNGERALSEVSTVGQRAVGALANAAFGDQPTNWKRVVDFNAAYTQVPRFNEVTGKVEMVTVPSNNYGTRVSDVIGVENPYGAFAVNTLTDPLFLLSARGSIGSLGRRAKAYMTDIGKANTNAFMEQVARGPAQPLAGSAGMAGGRPGHHVVGNVKHGAGAAASHNASRVTSTGGAQFVGRPPMPNAPVVPSNVPLEGFTPYIGLPGFGMQTYGTNQYGIGIDALPIRWQYQDSVDGSRRLVEFTPKVESRIHTPRGDYWWYGNPAMGTIQSSNTQNLWRQREPGSGVSPRWQSAVTFEP